MSLRSVAISIALVLGISAWAAGQLTPQPPPNPDQGYYGQNRAVYVVPYASDPAYQQGFRDGMDEGQKDRHKNHDYRATKIGKYEHPPDYDSTYGDRKHWDQIYQSGFAAGYYQGYYAVPAVYPAAPAPGYVVPPTAVPSNPAYQQGFKDGVMDGQDDRQSSHAYRALATSKYQHTPGYDSSYGDKDQYKEIYRQGYAAGYQQGYTGVLTGATVASPPAYPAPPAYTNSQAFQLGYQDGINDGRDDHLSGRDYRATTTDRFQDAPGYTNTLGAPDMFKELYRRGYVAGYQAGFSGQ
jgi:hypothetical protein